MTESKRYDTSIEAPEEDDDNDSDDDDQEDREEEKNIIPNRKMQFDEADPFLYMQLSNFGQP